MAYDVILNVSSKVFSRGCGVLIPSTYSKGGRGWGRLIEAESYS